MAALMVSECTELPMIDNSIVGCKSSQPAKSDYLAQQEDPQLVVPSQLFSFHQSVPKRCCRLEKRMGPSIVLFRGYQVATPGLKRIVPRHPYPLTR